MHTAFFASSFLTSSSGTPPVQGISDKMDELRWVFRGVKRLRGSGRRVEAVMWVLAVMPASKLEVIADAVGGVDIYTNMALSLHDYRYNGPDPKGVLSPCPSDEVAAHDVKKLVAKVEEPTNGPSPVNGPSSI